MKPEEKQKIVNEFTQKVLEHPALQAADKAIVMQALRTSTKGYEGEPLKPALIALFLEALSIGEEYDCARRDEIEFDLRTTITNLRMQIEKAQQDLLDEIIEDMNNLETWFENQGDALLAWDKLKQRLKSKKERS